MDINCHHIDVPIESSPTPTTPIIAADIIDGNTFETILTGESLIM